MMSGDERIKERCSKRMLIKSLLNGHFHFNQNTFKYVFLEGTRTLDEVLLF